MHAKRFSALTVLVAGLFALIGGCPVTSGLPGSGGQSGAAAPINTPPTPVIAADVVRGIAPLTVQFDSSASSDDGLIVSRTWDFDDGTTSSAISPRHTFRTTGEFNVRLTVVDDQGASNSRTQVISVTQAPVPIISVDRTIAESAPALFNFDASQSFDPDGEIIRYQWNFDDGSLEVQPTTIHTFATPGTYRVELTVTDNTGVTASATEIIVVGIPEPDIAFAVPPADVLNIVASPESPLWVYVNFDVEPGVPYTIQAGLDQDVDPCDAQGAVYGVSSGELIARASGPADRVRDLAFDPDGDTLLMGDENGLLSFADPLVGDEVRTPDQDDAPAITSLAYSPGGEEFVHGGSDGSVVLRAAGSGTVLRDFAGHGLPVNDVAFGPNGQFVASASDDNTAIVWNVATGNALITLDAARGGHSAPVTSVAFNPTDSDLLVTGGEDDAAILWRVSDGSVVKRFAPQTDGAGDVVAGHAAAVTAVVFSPGGSFVVTGSADGTAKLWPAMGSDTTEIQTYEGHDAALTSVAVSPGGGLLATGSEDGTGRLWDLESGTQIRMLEPCTSTVSAVAFDPDGELLALGVAARNAIQLDADPPQGEDIDLTIPTALNLASLTDAQIPGQYFLWAQVDTDRTETVRTYANARVNVVNSYTNAIAAETPRVPLINDRAVVVAAPNSGRQIIDLGPMSRGDELNLSLAPMPGYGQQFGSDIYSVLILDAQGRVYTWLQAATNEFPIDTSFTRDTQFTIGHDSPSYFAVLDGCRPPLCDEVEFAKSIAIRVNRNETLVPREQRIYLNFLGGEDVAVGGVGPQPLAPFNAQDFGFPEGETEVMKNLIVNRLNTLFGDYNVTVSTSDAAPPAEPFLTVYFGGDDAVHFFGAAAFVDPRNNTLGGSALVATGLVADTFPTLTSDELAVAFGNVAAHQIGHLLGLRDSQGGPTDIMDDDALSAATPISSGTSEFTAAPLDGDELQNGLIGIQDPLQIFSEVIGLAP